MQFLRMYKSCFAFSMKELGALDLVYGLSWLMTCQSFVVPIDIVIWRRA